MKQMLTCG